MYNLQLIKINHINMIFRSNFKIFKYLNLYFLQNVIFIIFIIEFNNNLII